MSAASGAPALTSKFLARARYWKDAQRAQQSGRGGPLVDYVRSGSFELCVPCAGSATCLQHIGAYERECHVVMQDDVLRMESFRRSIQDNVRGKVCLDVGAGPGAVLAVMAAQAGAARVYAVEGHLAAAAAAARTVRRMEGDGTLRQGVVVVVPKASVDLAFVDIPERSVEVVIHELLGFIASSEGVLHFIRELRPFLAPGCLSIPALATTLVAPGVMPPMDALLADSRVTKDRRRIGPGEKYLLCTRVALPRALLLADPQPMEAIRFSDEMPAAASAAPAAACGGAAASTATANHQERELEFAVEPGRPMGGFYVWMRADFDVRVPGSVEALVKEEGSPAGEALQRAKAVAELQRVKDRCCLALVAQASGEEEKGGGGEVALLKTAIDGLRVRRGGGGEASPLLGANTDGANTTAATISCDAWHSGATSSWPVVFVPCARPTADPGAVRVTAAARGLGGLSPSYSLACTAPALNVVLEQADIYPWCGGDWCRACLAVTATDEEHRSAWAQCCSCGAAFHRACLLGMEGGVGEGAFERCLAVPACPAGQCGAVQTHVAPHLREPRCQWRCPRCLPPRRGGEGDST